ncbi:hypothetical protein ANN_13838 [Periplaneta americana]|uniref:Uncharacterized protein n=1 Tax=Periplaneta americana TaxID=6978 RepID=A0ABQ8SVN0_PERAM|nr:hypothetical protein ANN_13838 [Periplaneta americana]
MAGLCEGGDESPGSLKARLAARRYHINGSGSSTGHPHVVADPPNERARRDALSAPLRGERSQISCTSGWPFRLVSPKLVRSGVDRRGRLRNVINLVDKFRATECTKRKKSVRWPTKVIEDAVEDTRERMQGSPNKSVKKLAVEIWVFYVNAHKILRNKLGPENVQAAVCGLWRRQLLWLVYMLRQQTHKSRRVRTSVVFRFVEALRNATEPVRSGFDLNEAAKKFGVLKATLASRNKYPVEGKVFFDPRPVLGEAICNNIREMTHTCF